MWNSVYQRRVSIGKEWFYSANGLLLERNTFFLIRKWFSKLLENSLFPFFIYRFYFKTEVDGEAVFQEENEDGVSVPLWKGTVTVQCSDCGLLW